MKRTFPDIAAAALCACAVLAMTVVFAHCVSAQIRSRQPEERRTQQTPSSRPGSGVQSDEPQTSDGRQEPAVMGAQPDLSITARVTAESLRFEKVPNPKVEFTGQPRRDTVWDSQREHLPEQVRPGVTYRNIGITLRITSVFADIDRIVAEALGEVPATDDAQPISAATPETPYAQTNEERPNGREPLSGSAQTTEASRATQAYTRADAAKVSSPSKADSNASTTPRRRLTRKGRGR
jgi:hypothetical protein